MATGLAVGTGVSSTLGIAIGCPVEAGLSLGVAVGLGLSGARWTTAPVTVEACWRSAAKPPTAPSPPLAVASTPAATTVAAAASIRRFETTATDREARPSQAPSGSTTNRLGLMRWSTGNWSTPAAGTARYGHEV
jgi:hypothetical protein